MTQIPDISDTELADIHAALEKRYGKAVETQLADTELRLDPPSPALTSCPTVFWSERDANFVVCKVGPSHYRCQFYYSPREQFGTGREVYDDLQQCVTVLLQVQADHERQTALDAGRTVS